MLATNESIIDLRGHLFAGYGGTVKRVYIIVRGPLPFWQAVAAWLGGRW